MKNIDQFDEKIIKLHHPREPWLLMLGKEGADYRAILDTMCALPSGPITTSLSRTAFYLYARHEQPTAPPEVFRAEKIAEEIRARLEGKTPVYAGILGRSGSGKTAVARNVAAQLTSEGVRAEILSTDDYNRGEKALLQLTGLDTWSNWDAPIVYDTAAMAHDLRVLRAGKTIPRRAYNFETNEPEYRADVATIEPADVIIVEGIMANSPNLSSELDLCYEVPTPLATCIGRRVLRDVNSGRAESVGGSPRDVLRYQLEIAEPEYRKRFDQA